jgi:hypothetical protein
MATDSELGQRARAKGWPKAVRSVRARRGRTGTDSSVARGYAPCSPFIARAREPARRGPCRADAALSAARDAGQGEHRAIHVRPPGQRLSAGIFQHGGEPDVRRRLRHGARHQTNGSVGLVRPSGAPPRRTSTPIRAGRPSRKELSDSDAMLVRASRTCGTAST